MDRLKEQKFKKRIGQLMAEVGELTDQLQSASDYCLEIQQTMKSIRVRFARNRFYQVPKHEDLGSPSKPITVE